VISVYPKPCDPYIKKICEGDIMRADPFSEIGYCGYPPGLYKESRSTNFPDCPPFAASPIPRGRALFWEGEQQPQRIEIVEGVVRAVRLLENGNRQILAFFWPGDVVMPSQSYCQQFTAEAVTNCRVRLSSVSGMCHGNEPCGARQILTETLSLITSMSQKNSIARTAWFLLRIRRHLPEDRSQSRALKLLIPRADIADYVGTSTETVCRTLADFKSRGLIDLPNRKTIRFINLPGLQLVAGD
jgi:CRP-like cAMP-binding protein